jgi:hypothetical protein
VYADHMTHTTTPKYANGVRVTFDNINETLAVGDTVAVWVRTMTPTVGTIEFINDTASGEVSFGWAGWSTTVSPKGTYHGNPFWQVQVLS